MQQVKQVTYVHKMNNLNKIIVRLKLKIKLKIKILKRFAQISFFAASERYLLVQVYCGCHLAQKRIYELMLKECSDQYSVLI